MQSLDRIRRSKGFPLAFGKSFSPGDAIVVRGFHASVRSRRQGRHVLGGAIVGLNWPTYLVNSVVIVFIITVTIIALCMLEGVKTDPLHGHVQLAFILFLIVFISLSVILFGFGIYLWALNRWS
jgi:hypothetical protein